MSHTSYTDIDGIEEREADLAEQAERDAERTRQLDDEDDRDEGYHTNEYGEIIAHAITVTPRDVEPIMDAITRAVRL